MIIGFAVFWPLGLAMLAWIIWGDEIGRKAEELKGQFRPSPTARRHFRAGPFRDTGNVAFDEWRERELKRLEEERRKLDEMRAEFETFLKELRRVKDQEEFDRFMQAFRNRPAGPAKRANDRLTDPITPLQAGLNSPAFFVPALWWRSSNCRASPIPRRLMTQRGEANHMKAALALSALALAASAPASAQSLYSTVYVFGDSLSDRGRIPGLIEEQVPGFPLTSSRCRRLISKGASPTARPMPSGCPTCSALTPAPDQNFAVGGAETGDGNISDALLPPSIELPGIAEQIDSFVSSGESIGSDALVVLYGGLERLFRLSRRERRPDVGRGLGLCRRAQSAISRTTSAALLPPARTTILVPNVPNLGATPSYLGSDKEAAATALVRGTCRGAQRRARRAGRRARRGDRGGGLRHGLRPPAVGSRPASA